MHEVLLPGRCSHWVCAAKAVKSLVSLLLFLALILFVALTVGTGVGGALMVESLRDWKVTMML